MSLTHRVCEPELMDEPGLDTIQHRAALRGLGRLNRWSRTSRVLWSACRQLMTQRNLPALRVLDLACGGGDIVMALSRQARDHGVHLALEGWDISATAIEYARAQAQTAGLENLQFRVSNALEDEIPPDYDVIFCTLFLHHLNREQAVALLARMKQATRCEVWVDDLIRSRLGYGLAWSGCRILTRSPVVHVDGPRSVQAAFTKDEVRELARDAGLQGVQFQRHWPQRFLMRWSR